MRPAARIRGALTYLCAVIAIGATTAHAAGELVRSWKTNDGWLTELRTHPDGAKVCSTGKAFHQPHAFGFTFVRSGPETVVMLVDQQQPPTDQASGTMTFMQAGQTVAALAAQVAGPAWTSSDPRSPETTDLLAALKPGPMTVQVAGRTYRTDITGFDGAKEQMETCLRQAGG
jgi:uncharacterized protein (DUF2342 family)